MASPVLKPVSAAFRMIFSENGLAFAKNLHFKSFYRNEIAWSDPEILRCMKTVLSSYRSDRNPSGRADCRQVSEERENCGNPAAR